MTIHLSVFRFQEYRPQCRNGEFCRPITRMVLALHRGERAVVDVGAAVLLVVRGQHLGPVAALRQRNLIVLPRLAGEVDHDDELFALAADAQEAERIVIGVIAGQPLESRRSKSWLQMAGVSL